MTDSEHRDVRALLQRHFGARISPAQERRLRDHLPGCASCTLAYRRRLWASRLDPTAPSAKERLAKGLGLEHGRGRGVRAVVPLLAAAALGALYLVPRLRSEFTPRGGRTPAPFYKLYRVPPQELGSEMARSDSLAVAVDSRSPVYFMLFGLDEAGRLYWYYPAWQDASANPASVRLEGRDGLRELPEAIRQDVRGGSLTLCGLFTDVPWTVRAIEAKLAQAGLAGLPSGVRECHKVAVH